MGGIGGGSFSKRSMVAKDGLGGDGFVVDGGRSPSTSSKDGEDGGVKNKSSIGSRLIAISEVSLDSRVGAGGGVVNGGGVDLGSDGGENGCWGGEEVLRLTKQHGLTLILAVHFRLVLFSLGIMKRRKRGRSEGEEQKWCTIFIEEDLRSSGSASAILKRELA
ncbi:hypothetical protein Tco_0721985 [Tanacetum coccineum]